MWPLPGLKSVLPPEMTMDGPVKHVRDVAGPSPTTMTTMPSLPERPSAMTPITPLPTPPESPLPPGVAADRRPSAGNLRTAFRPTIRAVTPDPPQELHDVGGLSNAHIAHAFKSNISPQSSPRSIPGGALSNANNNNNNSSGGSGAGSRRQGWVFSDALASSFDSASSSPPPRQSSYRPRTHTMDGASAFRQQPVTPAAGFEDRHRVGSFSSSSSLPAAEDLRGSPLQPPRPPHHPPPPLPPSLPTALELLGTPSSSAATE